MMSQRFVYEKEIGENVTHIIMDYSDFGLAGDKNMINNLQEWEKQNLINDRRVALRLEDIYDEVQIGKNVTYGG